MKCVQFILIYGVEVYCRIDMRKVCSVINLQLWTIFVQSIISNSLVVLVRLQISRFESVIFIHLLIFCLVRLFP